ncbi:MAG: hypothetical protein KJ722_03090 [Candidatus Omnitrophica bacterium]|nr:hypothetical protein [Candidatus Omnitrophota bacterium]
MLIFFVVISTAGCEAFVRKFTRKPKDKMKTEELVLVPQEYKPAQVTKEEQYRQAFLFWKNWHDELIDSLTSEGNRKKQIDCLKEAVNSLLTLRQLLNTGKKKKLDIYLDRIDNLRSQIDDDIYGSDISSQRADAEKLKREILREFSYEKIKKCLV